MIFDGMLYLQIDILIFKILGIIRKEWEDGLIILRIYF